MNLKRFLRRLMAFVLALTVFGTALCGDSLIAEAKGTKPTKITLNEKSAVVEVGNTLKLKVKAVTPKKATSSVKWSTSNKKIATVSKKGVVKAKKTGTVTITATSTVNKKVKVSCKVKVMAKGSTITRGEWVASLVKKLGYTAKIQDAHFKDLAKSKYRKQIETAFVYGLLPYQNVGGSGKEAFEPNKPVTREFAAYTAVKAAGFANIDEALKCSDQKSLHYPSEDATAVKVGLISLKGGKFKPTTVLSKKDKNRALKKIDQILASRKIDPAHKDQLVYADDVVQAKTVKDYDAKADNGKLVVSVPSNKKIKNLSKGDKLVLPATDAYPEGVVLIVDSVNTENGDAEVTGTIPEDIFEVLDKVDMEGSVDINLSDLKLPKGVRIVGLADTKENRQTFDKLNVGKKIDISDAIPELSDMDASLDFKVGQLNYDIAFDGTSVESLYLELPYSLKFEVEVSGEQTKEKKIMEVSKDLPGEFFSVGIGLWLDAKADGKMVLEMKMDNSVGVELRNGSVLMLPQCVPSSSLEASGGMEAGFRIQLSLYFLKTVQEILNGEAENLYNVYLSSGVRGYVKGKVTRNSQVSNTPIECLSIGVYLYGRIGCGKNSWLTEWFKKKLKLDYEKEFFTEDNSPLKYNLHYENGVKVAACTFGDVDDSELAVALTNTAGKNPDDVKALAKIIQSQTEAELPRDLKSGCYSWDYKGNLYGLYLERNRYFKGYLKGSLSTKGMRSLEFLYCPGHQLTSLDVGDSTKLERLDCQCNKLSSLDVRKNYRLRSIECQFNKLTSLKTGIVKDRSLDIYCYNNKLTSLDLKKLTYRLYRLDCCNNPLKKLDLTNNTKVVELDCNKNVEVTGYKGKITYSSGTVYGGDGHYHEPKYPEWEWECGD